MLQRRSSAFASPQRGARLDMSLRQDSASDQPGPLIAGPAPGAPQARAAQPCTVVLRASHEALNTAGWPRTRSRFQVERWRCLYYSVIRSVWYVSSLKVMVGFI